MKALQVFYHYPLPVIRDMKIRMQPGEIIRIHDILIPRAQYALQEPGGKIFNLPTFAFDGLIPWLDEPSRKLYKPFTINELVAEDRVPEHVLINSIASNLVQTGLMAFEM